MIKKVWDYVKQYHMLEVGDRIVAGISGGADSVCLFYVLKELCKEYKAEFVAVHINHGLRGEEADRDEKFVRELCLREGVAFYSFSYDVRSIAIDQGLSEEEAGRNVRYQSFLEICRHNKCNKIAIAHNRNDNAETVLFHLFRGTGLKGLSGMEPKRMISADFGRVCLIRPLMCLERREIESYLEHHQLSFITDSTNLTEDYTRNKIRNKIMTYAVQEINSGAIGNIAACATMLKEIEEYISFNVNQCFDALVKYKDGCYRYNAKALEAQSLVLQKGIIRLILEKLAGSHKDLEAKHVEEIRALCQKQVGKLLHLPYNIIAEREYDDIVIYCKVSEQMERPCNPVENVRIPIPGRVYIPRLKKYLITELIQDKNIESVPKNSCVKWIDYDKIENAVELRTRREGDYIQINSLGGRKKLKDYFIDKKLPRKLRDEQLLIADGSHIIWILGEVDRISEKYKVDETTRNMLLMKLIKLEEMKDEG